MDQTKRMERKIARLERRLDAAEAHGRALERVVRNVIGEAASKAFEFAVQQYGWHELHEMNEQALRRSSMDSQNEMRNRGRE